jgi:hypothetical protein
VAAYLAAGEPAAYCNSSGLDFHPLQYISEDNVSGKLTDERFMKLSRGYEQEQADLAAETATLAERIAAQEQQTLDLSRFLTQVRKHTRVTELTPTLLNELVERIEVHVPDTGSGKRVQKVDIYFNFVGRIDELDFAKAKPSRSKALPEAENGENGENGRAGSPKGAYLLYENA